MVMEFDPSSIARTQTDPKRRWLMLQGPVWHQSVDGRRQALIVKDVVLGLNPGDPIDCSSLLYIVGAGLVEVDIPPDHLGTRAWLSRKEDGGYRIVVASTIDADQLPRGTGYGLIDQAPKVFAVTHEIGHLLIRGHLPRSVQTRVASTDTEERFCDEFGRELIADGWVL